MPHPEAFFLPVVDGGRGQRFCLLHPAQGDVSRGSILYVHPFAEEMNKSRRMAALQARALSHAGYAVLQIDLLGCGDSSGDFGDAGWQDWVNDVALAYQWLSTQSNARDTGLHRPRFWLWGVRAGCLLAVAAARQLDATCHFLFWQPTSSGKQLLQQFLRLKQAGNMLGGETKGVMEGVRQQLAHGSSVEIAGYLLSANLASGLEQADLMPSASVGQTRRVEWFELSTREHANVGLASTKTITQWQQAGFKVDSHIVHGPAFWQTSEIEEAPGLIAATTKAVCAPEGDARQVAKTGP